MSGLSAEEFQVEVTSLKAAGDQGPGFTLMNALETQVSFRNDLDPRKGAANRVLFNGSGVAVGDWDNDGLPDLFFCGISLPMKYVEYLGLLIFYTRKYTVIQQNIIVNGSDYS